MRRMHALLAVLLATLVIAVMPARAYAGIGPSPTPDEIIIAGTALSEKEVPGVSYDITKGILTLNNYNGGPIRIDASTGRADNDQDVDLIINLVGTNTITLTNAKDEAAIRNPGSNATDEWARDIDIYSSSGGSLKINGTFNNSGSPDKVHFSGIVAGGIVNIRGDAKVAINMAAGDVSGIKNSSGLGVVASGIFTGAGDVLVDESAQLDISISGTGLCLATGVQMMTNHRFFVFTDKPLTIDLAQASVTGKPGDGNYPPKSSGVDSNGMSGSAVPITIAGPPKAVIHADNVCHIVQGEKFDNPAFPDYSYRKTAGQYTDTHTYRKDGVPISVDDLDVSFTAPSDNKYWGGHVVPTVTVYDGETKLAEMTDYALTYDPNNIAPGSVTVYIEGMGKYAGKRQVGTFTIAEPFKDVNAKTDHYSDIIWLFGSHITTGFPDGTYRPYDTVKRCDMAAFLYRLAGQPSFTPTAADKAKFNDVTDATPHAKEIWWLASTGISTGFSDGGFHPYAEIVRCDMAAFLFRLSVFQGKESKSWTPTAAQMAAFNDVSTSTDHAAEVIWLSVKGVSTGFGDGGFHPYGKIVRCDMAAFLHRMADKNLV